MSNRNICIYQVFLTDAHKACIRETAGRLGFTPHFFTLEQALPILGQKLAGYDQPDAVLTAVESRSSSPVRIPRDEAYQSAIRGLYPCGEGAGYAGGILSAAADGMRCAEQICQSISQEV